MSKKIIISILIIILVITNSYQLYLLHTKHNNIITIKNKITKITNDTEYLSLYKELKKEILEENNSNQDINSEAIEDKIGLLTRINNENKEGLQLSEQDLENIKNENNKIEQQILQLKLQKQEQQQLKSFPTYHQFPDYPTGCESVALYILLKYYNINVQVEDIVNNLKKGSLPYQNNNQIIGGNPETEFIGDPRTNYSYGVYNQPIADVGQKYKSNIISKTNFDFNKVLNLVNNNHPVIAWTTINLSNPYISTTWTYPKNQTTIKWISGEHAVVIFGTTATQVIVSDPYTGTIRYFDKELFKLRYNYLGRRVVYYE